MVALLCAAALMLPMAKPANPAPSGRSVILLVDSSPLLTPELRSPLQAGLRTEVERSANYRWVEPPAISLDELALALNCSGMDDVCIRKAGDTLKADAVILAAASSTPRKEVVLTLVHLKPQKPTRMAAVPLQEPDSTVGAARQALRALLGPVKPTRLVVLTTPPGAVVQLDGEHKGASPLTLNDIPEGAHRITVSKAGLEPQTVDVNIPVGESTEVKVTLSSVPGAAPAATVGAQATPTEAAPEEQEEGGGMRYAVTGTGAVGAGGGLLSLVVAAAALASASAVVAFSAYLFTVNQTEGPRNVVGPIRANQTQIVVFQIVSGVLFAGAATFGLAGAVGVLAGVAVALAGTMMGGE
ncbi:MAG: PEGA domain-containing protein [Myxococcota bacterium]